MKIFKYPLPLPGEVNYIMMPRGAKVLSVAEQRDVACVWALVDPTQPLEPRTFVTCGTGHMVPANLGEFLGTVLLREGLLVLHIFESRT